MPTERQWVIIGLFGFSLILLAMAGLNPVLWDNDRFNAILQAVVLTGILNMIAAFYFAGNQSSAQATANTAKAFDAISAAQGLPKPDVVLKPGETAQAEPEKES